ncbi:MAG: cupredoxin domain-containing protein, partial [Nitrosopumilus sp.]|nr:cupredoxin domain-containing protein [Nitrosopumilus sp.]
NVREVPLFYPEKVEQTVSFEEVNGKVQLVGITGIKGEVNPTLLTRTSFAYILTVINNGTTNHRLYIEGLNAQTDLLDPGQNDTITVFPNEEGTYNYYDKRETLTFLGKLKVVTVVPSDEFQGFLKDMI